MIEVTLRRARKPLTLKELKARLPRRVPEPAMREAIEHYTRLGCVTEIPEGILWTAGRTTEALAEAGLDVEGRPTFADEDPTASLHHDRHLYKS